MNQKRSQKQLILFYGGLLICLLSLGLAIRPPLFFKQLDLKVYDLLLRNSVNPEDSSVPVIVDIDEQSLADYGQWPWPRYRVAMLLEKIRRLGASSVALDMVFAEQDRTSPSVLQEQLQKDLKVDMDFENLPQGLRDNDLVLSNILKSGPFTLGYFFDFQKGSQRLANTIEHPIKVAELKAQTDISKEQFLYTATGATGNLEILNQASSSSGFFNTIADSDGILRRSPLLIAFEDQVYPSLGLAALLHAMDIQQVMLKLNHKGLESLRAGPFEVPLSSKGEFLLKYRGKGRHFPYIAAKDILEDRLPKDHFLGKIVFIGTSAAGLKDIRSTPFDPYFSGVEAHATIVDNILTSDFITRPDWALGAEVLAIFLSGLIIAISLAWFSAFWATIPLSVLLCAFALGSLWAFKAQGLYLSPSLAILSSLGQFSVLSLLRFWKEEQEKRYMQGAFGHYVSPAVVKQITESPEALSLSGEEKEVSIFFSDIRGFTTLSENLSASQVCDLLQEYFTPVTDIVRTHQGTLDKFIGDALMAFWNAPIETPNHQNLALDASLKMLDLIPQLNKQFAQTYKQHLAIGIGLHSGTARVGNMGSKDLFNYTLIGDNVNLASRLEGLCKFYGVTIVVSDDIRNNYQGQVLFQALDVVRVKGKSQAVHIYTAHPEHKITEMQEEVEQSQEAFAHYLQGNFCEAQLAYTKLNRQKPKTFLYSMYKQRCDDLILEPPSSWDGVFTHQSK